MWAEGAPRHGADRPIVTEDAITRPGLGLEPAPLHDPSTPLPAAPTNKVCIIEAQRPPTEDGFPTVCARCGEPLGDDAAVLYWHEDQLVFSYYHPGCPPVAELD